MRDNQLVKYPWNKLFIIANNTWDITGPSLYPESVFGDAEKKGGCNHRKPRGDARKRGLRSQWLSVASSFSLVTVPPSARITFFVILVTCISLFLALTCPPDPSLRLFSFVFCSLTPEKLPGVLLHSDQYLINSISWI